MKNKRFKSALSLLLVLLLCFSVMAPSFAAQTVDLAATGADKTMEKHANSATISRAEIIGLFGESTWLNTAFYGFAPLPDPGTELDTSTITYVSDTSAIAAGEYLALKTTANGGSTFNRRPNWNDLSKRTQLTLTFKTYYTASFTVTGSGDGALYLNGSSVNGSVNLYTNENYTVTAADVEGFTREVTGVTLGVAFKPTSDMTITAAYTKNKFATFTLTFGEGGTAQVLVNGEEATNRISEGYSFTVKATPDILHEPDATITVTKGNETVTPDDNGEYGPAADGEVYAINVTFKTPDPNDDTKIERDVKNATVDRGDLRGFFNDDLTSTAYYGIAPADTPDDVFYFQLSNVLEKHSVENGRYIVYRTTVATGNFLNPTPVWSAGTALYLTVKTYATVTWKNWDGSELASERVYIGATPTYDGEIPVRPEDMNNTYTFSAWDDGKTTYRIDTDQLPPVTGDVTYTAVFTAETKPLFVAHSITLGGDIGVNFYLDSNIAGLKDAETAVVNFAWDGGNYIKKVNLKELTPDEKGWYKATVNVVAAQMAHTIEATAFIDGKMFTTVDLYSVQEYAKAVYDDPEKYDDKGKPDELKALAAAMLHYGSEAQTVFADALTVKPDRADSVIADDPADYTGVTADAVAEAINGPASDLNGVATQLGAKYYTNSLIYLQNNTLRVYFTPNEYGQAMPNADAYAGSQRDYYYYAEKTNIPAAKLDDQQEFTVGDVNFCFSPLDYVKAVLSSTKMTDAQKNLAASLFLYNQKANAYFDEA